MQVGGLQLAIRTAVPGLSAVAVALSAGEPAAMDMAKVCDDDHFKAGEVSVVPFESTATAVNERVPFLSRLNGSVVEPAVMFNETTGQVVKLMAGLLLLETLAKTVVRPETPAVAVPLAAEVLSIVTTVGLLEVQRN